jgi:hypothetical protein
MYPNYVIAPDDRPWIVSFISPDLAEVATALLALPEPEAYVVKGHLDGAAMPLPLADAERLDRLVAADLCRADHAGLGVKWRRRASPHT